MKIRGLYQKRGWFYFQAPSREGVRPPPVALRTKDQAEAIQKAFELAQGEAIARPSKDSMKVAVEVYLREMKEAGRHGDRSSHNTKHLLNSLADEWGNPPLRKITKERVLAWWKELRERPGRVAGSTMSEASIKSYLLRLKGFLSWAVETGRLREHPMRDIRIGRVRKTRRHLFCTIEQRERLLADPPSEEIDFILHVGFFAGLRFEEMLAMTPDWISGDPGRLVLSVLPSEVWKPKDEEVRSIPVHPRLEAFLERYGRRRPYMLRPDKKEWKAAPGFRFNPKRQFKAYVVRRGLPWVNFYTPRHSFATHLASSGAPMIEIATMLGNSVKVCEESYAGFSPRAQSTIGRI